MAPRASVCRLSGVRSLYTHPSLSTAHAYVCTCVHGPVRHSARQLMEPRRHFPWLQAVPSPRSPWSPRRKWRCTGSRMGKGRVGRAPSRGPSLPPLARPRAVVRVRPVFFSWEGLWFLKNLSIQGHQKLTFKNMANPASQREL